MSSFVPIDAFIELCLVIFACLTFSKNEDIMESKIFFNAEDTIDINVSIFPDHL